jgi:hypothetical protein
MSDEDLTVRKEIPGFPGYFVDADGSVWSRRKLFRPGVAPFWRHMKISIRPDGYGVVGLRPQTNSKVKVFYVHRLMLETFVGPCPEGMIACHNDGNPRNNTASNLRWDTPANNSQDSVRHGVIPKGSKAVSSKLKEADIPLIRQLREHGFTHQKIADLFDVNEVSIRDIIHGVTWKHVLPPISAEEEADAFASALPPQGL